MRINEYTHREWTAISHKPPMAQPFIIRGGCESWPAFRALTSDYLHKCAGHTQVTVKRTSDVSKSKQMSLSEFLTYCDESQESDPFYLSDWLYRQTNPEIRELMEPPKAFSNWFEMLPTTSQPDWSWIYIGPQWS